MQPQAQPQAKARAQPRRKLPRKKKKFSKILEELAGSGGESFATDNPMKHVLTRVTDEGLIVEIFDLPGEPLFLEDTAEPTETLLEISQILTRVFDLVENQLANQRTYYGASGCTGA